MNAVELAYKLDFVLKDFQRNDRDVNVVKRKILQDVCDHNSEPIYKLTNYIKIIHRSWEKKHHDLKLSKKQMSEYTLEEMCIHAQGFQDGAYYIINLIINREIDKSNYKNIFIRFINNIFKFIARQ